MMTFQNFRGLDEGEIQDKITVMYSKIYVTYACKSYPEWKIIVVMAGCLPKSKSSGSYLYIH